MLGKWNDFMQVLSILSISPKNNAFADRKSANSQCSTNQLQSDIFCKNQNAGISFGCKIKNFGEVVEGKLFRGASPMGKPENIKELAKKGVKTIISLLEDYSEEEEKACKESGIEYVHNMLSEKVLSEANMSEKLKAIADLIAEKMKNGAVYIHCKEGSARTGLAIAAFQKFILKLSDDEIVETAKPYGSDLLASAFLSRHKYETEGVI